MSGGFGQLATTEPQLRRLVLVNLGGLSTAAAGVGIAALVAGGRVLALDFSALLVALLAMLAGMVAVRRSGVPGLIVWMTLSVAVAAFGTVWVTPFLTPLAVILLLLPLLAGYAHLSRRRMRLLLWWSLLAVGVLAAMGSWRDRAGIGAVPPVAETVSLTLSLPTVLLVIAYAVNQTYARLVTQTRELRASRVRMVNLVDAARRSIERDLHDGAQQQLVRMSVLIGQVHAAVAKGDDEGARMLLVDLGRANTASLRELRELARGIYPPLLIERGLGPALQAACRRSAIPVNLNARDIPRQSPEVESAAYFTILEALANAAKHSGAREAQVEVRATPALSFTVRDDGVGFDAARVPHDGGLLGMEVRVNAAGGKLRISSTPGRGTTISAAFPAG